MEPELVEALKSSPNVELVGVDEFLKMYSNRTTKRNGYLLGLSNGSADHHHAYYFYSRAMGLEPHPRQVGGFEDYVQRIYTETNEPIVFLIPKDFFNYQDFSYTRNEFVRLITLLKTVPRSGKVILVEGAYDFVPKELTGQFMVNAEPDEKLSDDFKNHIRGRVPSFEGFVPEK